MLIRMSLTKENYYEEVYDRFNDKSGEIFKKFRDDLKLLGILPKNTITNAALHSANEDDYMNLLKKKQLQEYLGFEVEFIAQEGDMVEEGFDPSYNILLRIFNVDSSLRSISYDIKWIANAGKRYKAAQYSEMIEESEIRFIEESISLIENEFTRIEQQVYKEAIVGEPPAKRAKRILFRKSRKNSKSRRTRRKN